jgi:hypothetical protein
MPDPNISISLNARGTEVKNLHNSLSKLGYTVPKFELDSQVFGVGTQDALLQLQTKYKVPLTGTFDDATKAALAKAVADAETDQYSVEGRIVFAYGLPAAGITLRIYSRGFGGTETRLSEIKTDDQGYYALPYQPGGKAANLEVRAVDAQGKEISLSATKYNAGKHEVLNLVAPASVQPLAPEYQRLTTDLNKQLGKLDDLAGAQENTERQDLTLLHQATGWDARFIALAAMAVKLNKDTGISQDVLYALFRAGLPTDKQQLANVSVEAIEKALGKAKVAGIVSLDDQHIAEAKIAFEKFAGTTRLTAKAPGALSSFGELLDKSGLTGDDRQKFESVYFTNQGAAADLWQKARSSGVSEAGINGLRLQGKLAYLTLNNAGLAESLQKEIGSPDNLMWLVKNDFYQAGTWKTRLNEQAIPPAYTGTTAADRLDAYAADLARKVRLSFPTQIIGRMIEKGDLSLGKDHDKVKNNVLTFFQKVEELHLDFALGRISVDAFVQQHQSEVFPGLAQADVEAATQSVKYLQRLYQITPTNEALKVASDLGFTSAYDIVAFPYEKFLDRFGDKFPAREEAELVYSKAQQVSAVTYNIATIARQIGSTPDMYATSPSAERGGEREQAHANLIKHYPTLESLFGSLDFCECEHCRSVLSPAAYLVDLLQFLDTEKKPYDALIERRPDLPNLPLTCENTNTSLPYIDVVNEILEYYVVNGNLANAVHDSGEATTPELLAEPQNILPEAYHILKDARYPLALPFDLWLETVRSFLDHFETPLWQVLEIFRPADELFPPAVNPQPYYRATIFAEYLGISPNEYGILTDKNPLAKWYELYGYVSPTEAQTVAMDAETQQRVDLNSAKALSRRLGVSYKELVEIVQTWFVNPQLDKLVLLRELVVDIADVIRYRRQQGYPPFSTDERTAFEMRLGQLTEKFKAPIPDVKTLLDNALQSIPLNQILVLADPDAGCNFDQTTLQYADGHSADPLVFLKLNLFVRLWRKLGWTIEETDRALQVFVPKNSLPLTGDTLGTALKTALLYLAHLKALDEQVEAGKDSRLKLLTLWSNLPTTGKNPLYEQLFLTPSVLKDDLVFDDPQGNYLSKAGIIMKEHLLALQGALNLTADEIGLILADAKGQPPEDAEKILDNEPLTLANVSLLNRYGLLAKALKLPIPDLIALKGLSGIDPFQPLSPNPLATLDDDHPFTQTLRFVEVAEKARESGFQIEDLDYLLRHRFDPVGKYRPDPGVLLALVKALATGIRSTQAEHAVPADPATLTDDVLRQKLALVLSKDVAETFFAMWAGTKEYEAVYPAHPDPAHPVDKLDQAAFTREPAIRLSYDGGRQRLIFRGVLLDAKKAQLKAAFPSQMVAALLDDVQGQAKTFFEKNLQKSTIGNQPVGFLDAGDFDRLFAPVPSIPEDKPETEKQVLRKQNEEQMRQKRKIVAEAFLAFLQQTLIRQLVVQTLATNLNADQKFTEVLLTNLLTDPGQAGAELLAAFTAAGEQGITMTFFAANGGTPLDTRTVPTADTAGKPAGTDIIHAEGYIEVSAPGAYRFFALCGNKDTEVIFHFSSQPDPLIQGKAPDGELSQVVELQSDVPYHFTLDAHNLGTDDVSLLVQSETRPEGPLAQLLLYPQAAVDRVSHAQVLLAKTLQLIQALDLSEREVSYLSTHAADFDGLNLSKLPTHEEDGSAVPAQLFVQFSHLADYTALKRNLAGETDDLIGVFENARRTYPPSVTTDQAKSALLDDLCKRVADLARRDVATVTSAALHLGFGAQTTPAGDGLRAQAPDFAQENGVGRLWKFLQVVEILGVPVDALASWATPAPDFSVASALRNAVKARYEPENWLRIAQPIFDKLRQRQRDALVAYIMHRQSFERIEQLFEYFLIDPGMEPVVQTSRIQLAISSVQLFIQRCLLNLEKKVHPSAINPEHWQWMKRYRIWEANRKIFLFPENWLEPEFRDDKTHLFQELESALLQGDVSNDLVENAFFNYLKKLEELARLDIVTMYCEENPHDSASNTLHVIGRTYSLPHKYFYRRYQGQMWMPWEPVTTEIEGDHIAAVVWRQRLHLFWVTFLVKATQDSTNQPQFEDNATPGQIVKTVSQAAPQKQVEVQLNWSEYFQGQWTSRESSGFGSESGDSDSNSSGPGKSIRLLVSGGFDRNKVFIHFSKEKNGDGSEGAVKVHLHFPEDISLQKADWAFRVVSKNSAPQVIEGEAPETSPYSGTELEVTWFKGSGPLTIVYGEQLDKTFHLLTPPDILQQGDNFSLLISNEGREYPIENRFFYQDNQYTFFVEPSFPETPITQREGWVASALPPDQRWSGDDWWKYIPIESGVPTPLQLAPIGPRDPGWTDSLAQFQPQKDWVTNPATLLQFDGRLVEQGGGRDLAALSARADVSKLGGLNVIGGGGLNSDQLKNLNAGRGLSDGRFIGGFSNR